MCNAAATLVGQNLGAGQARAGGAAVWLTGFYNMAFLGARELTSSSSSPSRSSGSSRTDPAVVRAAAWTACASSATATSFYAWGMVIVQAFNGAGDTATPTCINLFCYWLFQIPLAWTLARRWPGRRAACSWPSPSRSRSSPWSPSSFFRRGRWKTRQV